MIVPSLVIYDLTCVPVPDELLPDDHAHVALDAAVKRLKAAPDGRLDGPPCEIGVIAELEGAGEHYGRDEIEENIASSTLPEASWQGHHYRLSARVLDTLERAGVRKFRAHPLKLTHAATKHVWTDYWIVQVTAEIPKAELTADDLLFVDGDTHGGLYCNAAVKRALEPLKAFSFDKIEVDPGAKPKKR